MAQKRGKGRPEAEFTDEERKMIKDAASVGCTWDQIEAIVGRPARTMRKHCIDDYRAGKARAKMDVGLTLYQQAVGVLNEEMSKEMGFPVYHRDPNLAAAIFYLKTQGGWSEGDDKDDSKPGGTFGQSIRDKLAAYKERLTGGDK